ncbi:MAG: hypothetical protein HS126_22125 [Anaerolineales bacterium]|nr:hypothetical protein [Anaerolineales bacterium]
MFSQLNLTALLAALLSQGGGPRRVEQPNQFICQLSVAMAQPSITEHLENIMRGQAAFPYDGLITQVFATTVNVLPVGSRTVIRDVALPAHIKSDTIRIGYAVRLDQTAAKPTVLAIFEQFADPEMFNYAGVGVRVPTVPNVTVKATKTGWLVSWSAVSGATKYILYKNDTPDGDSPEEVIQLGGSTLSYTVAFEDPFIYYAVKACSGYLESDVSLWMTDMTPPAAPAWKAHAYQTGGHYVEWTHPVPSDVKEFAVYHNVGASDSGAIEITRTANLNTIVPYLDSYDYFGVQAIDWSGINKSAIVWTVEYDPTPATPPDFAANLVEGGGFICTWNTTAKAVSYEVQGHVAEGGRRLTGSLALYRPGADDHRPRRCGRQPFRVRAIGYDGSTSGWSATETDDNAPPQPTLNIINGAKQVTLGLDAADTSHTHIGFSHYILEMAAGSAGQGATTVDIHATFDSFPRVFAGETGVTTYYRLTPVDWAGNVGTPTAWTPGTPIIFGDGGATIQDKFDTYGGTALTPIDSLYWLSLAKVEQSESWMLSPSNKATWVSTPLEGAKAVRVQSNDPGLATSLQIAKAMNLAQEGRFTNDDYLVIQTRITDFGVQKVTIVFYNSGIYPAGSGYRRTFDTTVDFGSPFVAKRSEFVAYGPSPNWATIAGMQIYVENWSIQNLDMILDDIRIVKADPEDASKYNDTGLAWDYAVSTDTWDKGEWHIYPGNRTGEPYKPFSFGQVNSAYGTPDHWYLAHKPMGTEVVTGTIQAGLYHKENGTNGLAFYIKDVTPGAWTMYAVEADNVADTIKLVKWVAGVRTELGSASFPFISGAGGTTGQTIWVGADFSDYDADEGRIKVYASTVEGNVIQAGALKISVQDTEIGSGGSVGLLSMQSNVRFVNFTAGSPAHADVADVAKALDGPVVAGDVRRVHYNLDLNRWEYTDDGVTMVAVSAPADANKVDKVSAARPGVTRLYRRDNDSGYNVQNHYDGSRWWLRGYNGDTFHAECRVGYADAAASAALATILKAYTEGTSTAITSTGVWTTTGSMSVTANIQSGSALVIAQAHGWTDPVRWSTGNFGFCWMVRLPQWHTADLSPGGAAPIRFGQYDYGALYRPVSRQSHLRPPGAAEYSRGDPDLW